MVIFSGGKGLLGPQASGLLLGRPDLIDAARKAISPHSGIGRGMKVGKEEIIGLVAAVDRYLALDHEAERRELDQRAATLMAILADLPGIACEKVVPEIHNRVPHIDVSWTEGERGLTADEAKQRLADGDPPIGLGRLGEGQLRISTWMLRPGEDHIVGERVRALFA
jgi:L-seryl-tRNA(Ser) seleniumtransferase